MLDLRWLSTWQPYTEMLGDRLGWDDSVVSSVFWHDPNTHEGRVMQKLDLIMNEIIKQRERVERGYDAHAIIWVDDGAINNRTITALIHTQLASPLLFDLTGCPHRHFTSSTGADLYFRQPSPVDALCHLLMPVG